MYIIRNRHTNRKLEKKRKEYKKKKKQTGLILGLDLSQRSSGISVIDNDTKKILSLGKVTNKYKKTDLYTECAFKIKKYIEKLLIKYEIEGAMFEFVHGRFINTVKPLMHIQGAIASDLYERNIQSYMIRTGSARKFLGVKNKKKEAFNKIKKLYPELKLDFKKNNDEADALILALNYNNKDKERI